MLVTYYILSEILERKPLLSFSKMLCLPHKGNKTERMRALYFIVNKILNIAFPMLHSRQIVPESYAIRYVVVANVVPVKAISHQCCT
jgi:hypothetical protein